MNHDERICNLTSAADLINEAINLINGAVQNTDKAKDSEILIRSLEVTSCGSKFDYDVTIPNLIKHFQNAEEVI